MDTSWVKARASQIRQTREDAMRRSGIRLLDAQLIEAKAPVLWGQITAYLKSAVATFNECFADDPLRHVKLTLESEYSLRMKNSDFPYEEIVCSLNVPAQQFESRRTDSSPLDGTAGFMPLHHIVVQGDGNLGFMDGSVEEALKAPLNYIFGGNEAVLKRESRARKYFIFSLA